MLTGAPPPSSFVAASPAPVAPPAKFHRSRSSFIPNKWTRGPGDGTFGSIYLSFGGGNEYRNGGGPNLSFDRKRPEEIWEEEQAKKRAAQLAAQGGYQSAQPSKPKKQKPAAPAKSSKAKAKAAARAARAEQQARKLLHRARSQLLVHLSSAQCRLFSEADHVVAVSDDDLDELLRVGGGDANKVVAYLSSFDEQNRKFDDFIELMKAIQEARREAGDHGAGTEEEHKTQDEQEQYKQATPAKKQAEHTAQEHTPAADAQDAPAAEAQSSAAVDAPAAATAAGAAAAPAAAANPEESYGDDFE
jgi:hypothetical protein